HDARPAALRSLSVRLPDDGRLAGGDFPVDLRPREPEPSGREGPLARRRGVRGEPQSRARGRAPAREGGLPDRRAAGAFTAAGTALTPGHLERARFVAVALALRLDHVRVDAA